MLCRKLTVVVVMLASLRGPTYAAPVQRDVVPGITTERVVPGEPYKLAGKRIVFTNWYFVNPGDLDWVDGAGKSVYVHGNSAPDEAQFVGKWAPRGIALRAERPTIMGPLERPHRMIIQEGALYRGWTDNQYFESSDGLNWEKKANYQLDSKADGVYHVFKDPNAAPEERFKAVFTDDGMTTEQFAVYRATRPDGWEPRALLHYAEGKVSCLRGAVSADGIVWKTRPEPLVVEYSDSFNTAYFDRVLRRYVIFTRYWSIGQRAPELTSDIRNSWTGVGRRAIGRSESEDFVAFPPSEMILEAPPGMLPSEVFYSNCYTTIPFAPDHHLMFPTIWNAAETDATRIALATSHDGRNWHWVPGGDLMETAAFGNWNGGDVWATPDLIELPNGDWALPYLAHTLPHKYPRGQQQGALGYAIWPKGRMVALEAESRGEFHVIAVMPPGRKLKLNATTTRTGYVKAEVQGDSSRTLSLCKPLRGDLHWKTVEWGGTNELTSDVNQPLRLRFELDQAKIYGLEFE